MGKIFSKKWLLATLLVLAAMAVMIRLGIWQLDRLETRRAFNAAVLGQQSQPELTLAGAALDEPLADMEYRTASVRGEYDHANQIALRNQYYNNQWGVHLVTPLKISGSDRAVLVDRGWIPAADYESGNWSQYDEVGVVTVQGVIRASRSRADYGSQSDPTPVPGGPLLQAWNFINIPAISQQMTLALLPVYLQQSPADGPVSIPVRTALELDLTEGPHMGYALQWFAFAAILGVGYLVYLRRQDSRKAAQPEEKQSSLDRENG